MDNLIISKCPMVSTTCLPGITQSPKPRVTFGRVDSAARQDKSPRSHGSFRWCQQPRLRDRGWNFQFAAIRESAGRAVVADFPQIRRAVGAQAKTEIDAALMPAHRPPGGLVSRPSETRESYPTQVRVGTSRDHRKPRNL